MASPHRAARLRDGRTHQSRCAECPARRPSTAASHRVARSDVSNASPPVAGWQAHAAFSDAAQWPHRHLHDDQQPSRAAFCSLTIGASLVSSPATIEPACDCPLTPLALRSLVSSRHATDPRGSMRACRRRSGSLPPVGSWRSDTQDIAEGDLGAKKTLPNGPRERTAYMMPGGPRACRSGSAARPNHSCQPVVPAPRVLGRTLGQLGWSVVACGCVCEGALLWTLPSAARAGRKSSVGAGVGGRPEA